MPIRIRCRDKSQDREQSTEYNGGTEHSGRNRKLCYTDRKQELRILCGSVQLLLGLRAMNSRFQE